MGLWTSLTVAMVYADQHQDPKEMLGERLFTIISWVYPDLAGKITGVMLRMNNHYVLDLLIKPLVPQGQGN